MAPKKASRFSLNKKPGFGCFVLDGKIKCRGVHRFLREAIFSGKKPAYRETVAMARLKAKSKRKGRPRSRSSSSRKHKKEAMSEGERLDKEIERWVEIVTAETPRSRKARKQEEDAAIETFSQSTRSLITGLKMKGWTPIEAQGEVGVPEQRLATAFDLTLHTANKELVLTENKRGYDTYWNKSNGNTLAAPFQHIEATPRNEAILQAATTAHYYGIERGRKPDHVYVVRVHKKGVEFTLVSSTDEIEQSRAEPWVKDVMKHLKTLAAERA